MAGYKRKRNYQTPKYLRRPTKKARKVRFAGKAGIRRVVSKMLNRNIETKEQNRTAGIQQGVQHNNVTLLLDTVGNPMNIFNMTQGSGDPMAANVGNRVGDEINVKGITLKFFIENPVDRARTHYRIMLLKGAKGDTFDRSTIFKGDSGNKLMDIINTERFTVVAQRLFNVSVSNVTGGAVGISGLPGAVSRAGTATKYLSMWIPGAKFGRNGHVQYENGSTTQVKFFDYRICILCYDWYGTPADLNIVGYVNEAMSKMYFKDA